MASKNKQSFWVVFLITGLMLTTMGIALQGLGWPRYALMGTGLLLLLGAVLATLAQRQAGR